MLFDVNMYHTDTHMRVGNFTVGGSVILDYLPAMLHKGCGGRLPDITRHVLRDIVRKIPQRDNTTMLHVEP